MFCEVPLEGSGFLTLTLAYTSESLRRNGIRSGQFLTLDLPEIDFHGEAFVQCIQDTADAGSREGELLLAIQRRDEGDPGVMLYGQGNLAQQALDQRRARSREIVLVIDKPNGDRADIRLIRSVDWIETHNAKVGGEIFLDLPHMGARGFARVVAIEPCPPLGQGAGRLVTGTFRHTSGEVYDLKLASETKPIGVTASHPFWSLDRNAWVSAIDLEIGETLKTLAGTTVVESRSKREEPEPVYNIEVEGDHVYRVGESGVLVHNQSPGCDPPTGTRNYGSIISITFRDNSGNGVTGRVGDSATAYLTPTNVGQSRSNFGSSSPQWDWWESLRDVVGRSRPIEKGHILASTISGEGGDTWANLTPLFERANNPTMRTCEGFLSKLVTECHYCVDVTISVEGYGQNQNAPVNARPIMPTKIRFTWSDRSGCASGEFVVQNKPDATTLDQCRVANLPCRQ